METLGTHDVFVTGLQLFSVTLADHSWIFSNTSIFCTTSSTNKIGINVAPPLVKLYKGYRYFAYLE